MGSDPSGFGEFVIESLLGEGGMGKVYRARQVALDRWVALKVLAQAKEKKDFLARFYREAQSAARLVHPNIIQIYTVGECEGVPFFAMEYVEGVDLQRLARYHPEFLTIEETMEIVRSVARALSIAMEHGIVHRDIKPANIMIAKSGLIKVMDFGLAKGITTDQFITQSGLVIGTPAYMCPEQGAGRDVDVRSDIYSLGCVLYECLCDHPPFQADSVAALLYKHAYEEAEAPSATRKDVPQALEAACLKMLAKNPDERFQTPQELLMALAEIPYNQALAEMLLAKRVAMVLRARRPDNGQTHKSRSGAAAVSSLAKTDTATARRSSTSRRSRIIASPPRGDAAKPREAAAAPPAAQPKIIAGPAPALPTTAIEAPPAAVTERPANPPEPAAPPPEPAAKADLVAPASAPAPTAMEAAAKPPAALGEKDQLAASTADAAQAPRGSDPRTKAAAAALRKKFEKLADGRWSYKAALGGCGFAEGLAATLKSPAGEPTRGLGDCLLCSNWNRRLGCAIAYCYEMHVREGHAGLQLLLEETVAWTGAGRFDMAIALLDDYVKNNPEDAAGFRELARVYDRPDYSGRDRRRAIVLYRRFVELGRRPGAPFSSVEISRAEERAAALLASPPDARSSVLPPGAGVAFQCFYRGPVTCFACGALTDKRLVVARTGEVDPESGVAASDMSGMLVRATAILRHFKSERALKDEQARSKKELARLSALSMDELMKDAACVAAVDCAAMTDVALSVDHASAVRSVTIQAQQTHQLIFTNSWSFKADQCHELLRRKLASP